MWLKCWTEIEDNHVRSPPSPQTLCDLKLFLLHLSSRAGALCSTPSGSGRPKQGDWHIPCSSQTLGPSWGAGGKGQEERHIPSLDVKLGSRLYLALWARKHCWLPHVLNPSLFPAYKIIVTIFFFHLA